MDDGSLFPLSFKLQIVFSVDQVSKSKAKPLNTPYRPMLYVHQSFSTYKISKTLHWRVQPDRAAGPPCPFPWTRHTCFMNSPVAHRQFHQRATKVEKRIQTTHRKTNWVEMELLLPHAKCNSTTQLGIQTTPSCLQRFSVFTLKMMRQKKKIRSMMNTLHPETRHMQLL